MSKKATIDVTINGEKAKARLAEIKEDLKQLKILRDKAAAEGDIKGFNQLNAEMKKLSGEAKQLDRNVTDVNTVLKNISSASVRELQNAVKQATRDLNEMKRTDPGFADQQKKVSLLRSELDKATGKAREHQSTMARLADGFNKYFGMATAAIASLTGVILGFRKAADEFNQFEKKVDNLSALTGLVGEDLEYLTEQAKKLSVATIEGNVRITQSADAIVDAYTKVGSARPELLKNKEDLAAVTQEAMILAAAANSELQPAVDALAGVLNQFNMPASESRRIINAIAAGSKEGAGEIPYLTEAIEKSGTIAADAGISIENLVGIIETLAPRMAAPEMAGRNLRAIILKLQEGADDTNPAVVGFSKAIENLAAQNLNATELTKLFGLENVTAAKILINNRQEMDNYTAAVTNTNVALEQAATNTDNNASKLEQARNKLRLVSLELGETLAPALVVSTNGFGYLVRAMVAAPEFFRRYQIAIIAVAGALLAHNAALVKSTALKAIDFIWNRNIIAQNIRNTIVLNAMVAAEQLKAIWTAQGTIATKAATTAQYLWNAALKANPIGLVITALTALVSAIKLYDKYNADALRNEKMKADRMKDIAAMNDRLTLSYNAQQKIVDKMNTLSREHIRILIDQTDATLKQAEADLKLAIIRQEITRKENTNVTLWQRVVNQITSFNNTALAVSKNAVDAAANGKTAAASMQGGIDALSKTVQNLKNQSKELNDVFKAETEGDNIRAVSLSQLEEKMRLYQVALRGAAIGSEDFARIQGKISEIQKKTAALNDNSSAAIVSAVEEQVDAYELLNDRIAKTEKKIKELAAANKPVPSSLTRQLIEDKEKLAMVEETIKGIAAGISAISYRSVKQQRLVPAERNSGVQMLGPGTDDYEEQMAEEKRISDMKEQAAISVADSTQSAIFEMVKNRQQAALDHKLLMLDKQREAELKNDKLTQEERDKIQEKYRKKEAKLKLEAWKKQKTADIIQGIIKGALAVITAMSQGGLWMAIPAGIAVAAELAVIAAQKPPEFKVGGYTEEDLSDDKPAGITHANEFVANADATRNPSVRKVLDIIDMAQRSGTIRSINLPAVIEATTYTRQLKSGGYSSSDTGAPVAGQVTASGSGAGSEMAALMNRMAGTIDRLENRLNSIEQNGIKGKWVLHDFNQIKDKEDKAISATG